MLTLARNRQWWTTGPLLAADQRVGFAGSGLVWEYYPGQGIEIQWLGTFGAANGLYDDHSYDALEALLNQAVSLAALRGGGIAWEYDFSFDGGAPPWVSAITEGTAVEALAAAGTALQLPAYLADAHQALGIFSVGAAGRDPLADRAGARYLIYSFAPHEYVINAFIQSLVGLFDLASTGDTLAASLFRAGDAQARLDVPRYNTGYWSLYDQYSESTLSYHELLTGFLVNLCSQTHETTPTRSRSWASSRARPARRDDRRDRRDRRHRHHRRHRRDRDDRLDRRHAVRRRHRRHRRDRRDRPDGATGNPNDVFCTAAASFKADLKQPPVLTIAHLPSTRATVVAHVPITLSKISEVTFAVSYGGHVVSQTTLELGHGSPLAGLAAAARAAAWTVVAQRRRPRRQPRAGQRDGDDPRAAAAHRRHKPAP
jgi:hypothetical protein